jgi:hypothetical protein
MIRRHPVAVIPSARRRRLAVWRGAWLLLCVLTLVAGPLGQARPAAAQSATAWLDQSPPANWNRRGASVPDAPVTDLVAPDECAAQERVPQGTEEQQVSDRGWRLTAASQAGAGGARVVLGQTGYDGMCRPMGYQQFVFVNGGFIGTISPTTMDSRTDGSGSVQGAIGPDTLTAVFARYGADDPLCCPARNTTVTYRVDRGPTQSLLLPTSATTGVPGAAPAPPPPPAPPAPGTLASGTVVALRGTPHLWLAGADGALHWVGDTRALAGRTVDWSSRVEVDAPALRAARLGDPYLSAGMVRRGGPIYLARWEQAQAQPTLLHVQTIADLALFGITADNYGRFVLEEPAWNERYGFTAATLPTAELMPAAGG